MKIQVNIIPTLLLLSLAVVFAVLGAWQLERKVQKQDLIMRFEQAKEMSLQQAVGSNQDFAKVRVLGHYETGWQLLIDNRIWQGRPGVHVLNLFYPKQGIPVLVDRGWLAMSQDRRSLPEVLTPAGEIVISGLISRPANDGVQLGKEDVINDLDGSVLLTYLNIENVAAAAGINIAPLILKLDASDPSGFEDRDWQPAVILPAQHQAYALQWFALSIAAVILIFTMGIRLRRS